MAVVMTSELFTLGTSFSTDLDTFTGRIDFLSLELLGVINISTRNNLYMCVKDGRLRWYDGSLP